MLRIPLTNVGTFYKEKKNLSSSLGTLTFIIGLKDLEECVQSLAFVFPVYFNEWNVTKEIKESIIIAP